MVVLSPPGIIRPSQRSRSAIVRTSMAWPPARSTALRCASKSPCSARIPAVFCVLPATRLQQFAFGELRNVQAAHGLAQFLAGFEQLYRVFVVSRRFDDGAGALVRVLGFEYTAADEHRLSAQLHHQRGVGRSGDSAC